MTSERLYYEDAYTTRFTARVAEAGRFEGRPAVELESTYFYPESGGQEADRGAIGQSRVVDVQADDDGRVWHVLDENGSAPASGAEAHIDWARRFDHMQQHTGQHILSAAFERELSAATVSSHLGEGRNSLEVALAVADAKAIARVERAANGVVWEDRAIALHWADDEGVKRFALRKPPKVSGRIRIVEIPDWDVSACGGTHTRRTGEVGIIKVVRWERVRNNMRFEFLCGGWAFADYAWRLEALLEAARRRTLKDRELIAHLEQAATERDELKKRLQQVTASLIEREARERAGTPAKAVSEFFDARPRDELRLFALKCLEAGSPWVAVGAASPEPSLILGRAKGGTFDLKTLLAGCLERSRGKGGGSPDLLQVAAADAESARSAWEWGSQELRGRAS